MKKFKIAMVTLLVVTALVSCGSKKETEETTQADLQILSEENEDSTTQEPVETEQSDEETEAEETEDEETEESEAADSENEEGTGETEEEEESVLSLWDIDKLIRKDPTAVDKFIETYLDKTIKVKAYNKGKPIDNLKEYFIKDNSKDFGKDEDSLILGINLEDRPNASIQTVLEETVGKNIIVEIKAISSQKTAYGFTDKEWAIEFKSLKGFLWPQLKDYIDYEVISVTPE